MMTHSDPPSERPVRRAQRVSPGPLRVRLHRTCEGFLVNISETGALVQVPWSMTPDRQITLNLEVQDALLRLPARVVRSVPQPLQTAEATLRRTEYKVALEFSDLPPDQVEALQRLLKVD
jgi:hypothetical protein